MDFDLVGRDSFDHNFVHMSIRKETPWEETMLEEFKQGLSRINYPYSLRFSYSIEPTFNDVDSLFQDWYLSTYHLIPPFQLMPGENNMIFVLAAEDLSLGMINGAIDDFSSYLRFLSYPFELRVVHDLSQTASKPEIKENETPVDQTTLNLSLIPETIQPTIEDIQEDLEPKPSGKKEQQSENRIDPSFEETVLPEPSVTIDLATEKQSNTSPVYEESAEENVEIGTNSINATQETNEDWPKEADIDEEAETYEESNNEDEILEEPQDSSEEEFVPPELDEDERARQAALREAENVFLDALRRSKEEEARKQVFIKGDYLKLKSISDIYTSNVSHVEFEGELFDIDEKNPHRKTRKGKIMMSCGVGDLAQGSAVYIRMMESRNGLSAEDILQFGPKSNGTRVNVRGAVEKDTHTGQKQVFVHYITKLPPQPLRSDSELEQRVELHLHSKFSAMDGLGEISDYLKLAIHWGMPAMAVTDHGVIQSFPAAENALAAINKDRKKKGIGPAPIKMLYGCELYMFDWPKPVFNAVSDKPIHNQTYCVFDFETTGVSHTYDRPIEFGAVIVGPDGIAIKRMDRFIDPEMELPQQAMEINHITPEMLVGAPKMQEAIKEISEFIGDSVLVAHQAPFDVEFLNMMRASAGMEPIKNTVVDTLPVAMYLFPEAGSLAEKALANRLEIHDDSGVFHRADYDAEQLSRIWLSMIPLLQKKYKNPNLTFEDLNHLPVDTQAFYKHPKTFHTCVIAKNPAGLKALYKIISESETTYLSPQSGLTPPTPTVPRDFLNENRENLFVGSACMNGRVFEMAMNGTQQDLEEEMAFYDYIEIQPKENYSWLIGMEQIDEPRLMNILGRIVDTAEKLGKMVIATGDCHYVNPAEKITRDIYICSKGLGGSAHPLMRGRARHAEFPNPDQHFRSTKEMLDSFRSWLPEEKCRKIVIENSRAIADACEPLRILKDRLYTPDANLPDSDKKLRELCYQNLKDTYGENPDPLVKARLDRELDGIINNGYAVTYYIAHLLVKHAMEDTDNPEHMGYFIGSRGSVGSSFAATMAGITEVNPLPPHYLCPKCKHFEWANDDPQFKNLRSGTDLPHKKCPECGTELLRNGQSIPFETFLGFDADKVPDIDLNFPADYQAKGHLYTREILSTPEENRAYANGEFVHSPHVIRAGTIAAAEQKNAFGYVKGYYERVLHKEVGNDDRAYCSFLASKCTGVKRTTGQHPGGIVVIPSNMDIFDFTPFQHPADDPNAEWLTTHYEFASMHDSVLKLDELGHVEPVALRMQCNLTGIDIAKVGETIPLDDPQVLSLFGSPKALKLQKNPLGFKTGAIALPEFGTSFVQGLLEEARPKTFNDLLIISGLSHGTDVWNNNAEDIIVHQGRSLNDVVGCRDDIMNYLISMGCDPSMSFRIMEDVRHGKGTGGDPRYNEEMKKNNVPDWYIESLNKIKYLFPRAHAAAYVIGAVRTGWFKVHHPLEFYATYFSTRCDKFDIGVMSGGLDRIVKRINEIKGNPEASDVDLEELKADTAACEMVDRGYSIENISLMESDATVWKVCKERNCVIPPFKAISGFPSTAAEGIVKARANGGEFLSQEDLMDRVKSTKNEEESKRQGKDVFYSIGDSALKALEDLGVLKGLSKTNQLSLFDF